MVANPAYRRKDPGGRVTYGAVVREAGFLSSGTVSEWPVIRSESGDQSFHILVTPFPGWDR